MHWNKKRPSLLCPGKTPGHNNPGDVALADATDFHLLTSVKEKSMIPEGVTLSELLYLDVYQGIIDLVFVKLKMEDKSKGSEYVGPITKAFA